MLTLSNTHTLHTYTGAACVDLVGTKFGIASRLAAIDGIATGRYTLWPIDVG